MTVTVKRSFLNLFSVVLHCLLGPLPCGCLFQTWGTQHESICSPNSRVAAVNHS